MTNSYLKKVKDFEDEVVAPAKNSNWWTSEHTSKVNAYLSRIKTLLIGKSAARESETWDNYSDENAGLIALAGLKTAIHFELPANKFKFIINRDDLRPYMQEALEIKEEKDYLMSAAKDGYNHDAKLYRDVIKKAKNNPEARKGYEDELKSLYDKRERARKKLASVYGVHVI